MRRVMRSIFRFLTFCLIVFLAYAMADRQKSLIEMKKSLSDSAKTAKDMKGKYEADLKAMSDKMAAKDKRIKELEDKLRIAAKSIIPTYFIKKSSNSKVLPNGTFEQIIELEADGENTVPLMSVIAESRDEVKIKTLTVEGPTIPRRSEREDNSNGTLTRLIYRFVKPGPVKITIIAEKETPLNVIIDPYRDV
jgi:cell division protein FtsB